MTKEEALNIVKNIYQTDAEKEALATLIPELKESEDEMIRKTIFKALSKKDARDALLANGIQVSDALAWLEKQGEQKPAEWSEEDVLQYSKILFCLDSMVFPSTEERQEMMNWLKSLKPNHWKPSEEQMKSVNEIVNFFANAGNPYMNDYLYYRLVDLRNDLKKL